MLHILQPRVVKHEDADDGCAESSMASARPRVRTAVPHHDVGDETLILNIFAICYTNEPAALCAEYQRGLLLTEPLALAGG